MCWLTLLIGRVMSWCDSLPVTHIKCNAIPWMIMIPVYNGNCSCSHRRLNYVYMISIAREYITIKVFFVVHLKTAECQGGKGTYKTIRLEKMITHSPLDQVVTTATFNTLRPWQKSRIRDLAQKGEKPLPETMVTAYTVAYMCHHASVITRIWPTLLLIKEQGRFASFMYSSKNMKTRMLDDISRWVS